MHRKCVNCGSENVRRSRIRKGEQTITRILLRPLQCRDCKVRFWAPYSRAYLKVGAVFFCGLLLAYFISMSLIMPSESVERLVKQDAAEIMTEATITGLHQNSILGSTSGIPMSVSASTETEIEAEAEAEAETTTETKTNTSLTKTHSDKSYYTVQLFYEKAQKGDAGAQYQLGLLFMNGKGTIQDFEEAARWFELAAEKNHALAQYQLGLIYKTGFGVDVNLGKSYMWFNLSAAAGIEQAALERDRIILSLSSEQLRQAQKSSREWLRNIKSGVVVEN